MAEKICALRRMLTSAEAPRPLRLTRPDVAVGAWVDPPAERALSDDALKLAVGIWLRHHHTRYDALFMKGREHAWTLEEVKSGKRRKKVLEGWSGLRKAQEQRPKLEWLPRLKGQEG